MKFHILTLFPEMFSGPLSESIIGRAIEKGILQVHLHNIRDYAVDRHRTVDDAPYGGGAGMLMKLEPLVAALEAVRELSPAARILVTSPRGCSFNQKKANDLAEAEEVIIVCGRYEGIDERLVELSGAEEISIGDFVLTGGELAAMVIVDAVGRLLPGVLGSVESASADSFSDGLLEYPQYTRPPEFRGMKVPEILLSGDHREIEKWRREQSLLRTRTSRPDLLEQAPLSKKDRDVLLDGKRNSTH